MPDRKVKIPFPTPQSPLVDGIEVSVEQSTERWTDVVLADGSALRLKVTVVSAVRESSTNSTLREIPYTR